MKKVKLSVILPVFNGEKYIAGAVKSILNQTFKEFELIIVNDGSFDKTSQIIRQFKDKRIRIIENNAQYGVAKCLNLGLKYAVGEYIARCDADDINSKNRFKIQINFLEKNSEYVLVGSRFDVVDYNGKPVADKVFKKNYENLPLTDREIRKTIFKNNPISHPTVIFRKKIVERVGFYNEAFNGAEDYDLWFKLSKVGKLCNLPQALIKRRMHPDAISIKKHFKSEILALLVRLSNLPLVNFLGLDIVVGFFTFLLYRYWFVYLLFKDRMVPPEPDDSYFYLAAAKIFPTLITFEDYRLFLYSGWLKLLSFFVGQDMERTYLLNFYLGVFILFIVVVTFLKRFEDNVLKRAILLSVLGLYTGTGAYHGFYWVVPSFYQLIFFLILLNNVISQDKNKLRLFLLTFIFIFIHPSSIYISLFFGLFLLFKSIFLRNHKNSYFAEGFIFLSSLFSYLIYSLLSTYFYQLKSPESPKSVLNIIDNVFANKWDFASWAVIYKEYFHFFLLNTFVSVVSIISLILAFKSKKMLLPIFSSLLVLVLVSSAIPYGYRSLGYLWPVTFLLIGYSILEIYQILSKYYFVAVFSLISAFVSFWLLNTLFNNIWVSSLNRKLNFSWDRQCINKLVVDDKKIYNFNLMSKNAFVTNNFPIDRAILVDKSYLFKKDDLYIESGLFEEKPMKLNAFSQFLANKITRTGDYPYIKHEDSYWSTMTQEQLPPARKIFDCGYFNVKEVI